MPLPGPLSTALQQIVHGLINFQGPQKRVLSVLFQELPDKKDYADYYLFIKEPRALNGILDSLKRGRYSSPQAVAYDLFLIWTNARTYNEQGSDIYKDADRLEKQMQKLWQDKTPPLPSWSSLPRPGELPSPDKKQKGKQQQQQQPKQQDPDEDQPKVKRLKVTLGSTSTPVAEPPKTIKLNVSKPAEQTPQPSLKLRLGAKSAASAPEAGPSTPAAAPATSTSTSSKKKSKKAASPAAPPPVPTPAAASLPAEAPSAREARLKEREESADKQPNKKKRKSSPMVKDEDDDATGGQLGAPPPQGVDDQQSGWLEGPADPAKFRKIVEQLKTVTDASGRILAGPIMAVPDVGARPDYHERVKEPVALETIEKRLAAGAYTATTQFEQDVVKMFKIARLFIKPSTPGPLYADLNFLQRLYQELTKSGPASPPPPVMIDDMPYPVAFANDSVVVPKLPPPAGLEKVPLNNIHFKGEDYRTGDWVLLNNPENPGKPVIAQIFETYTRSNTKQRWVQACWYFRPEETVHPVAKTFFENEVFKTQTFREHCVEDIVSRCLVLFNTHGTIKGQPAPSIWDTETPLYYVSERYKEDGKTFKKIKSWSTAVPAAVKHDEVEIIPFADGRVEKLPTKKSPFAEPVDVPEPVASYPPINANAPSAANRPAASPENATSAPAPSAALPAPTAALPRAVAAVTSAPPSRQSNTPPTQSGAPGSKPPMPAARPSYPVPPPFSRPTTGQQQQQQQQAPLLAQQQQQPQGLQQYQRQPVPTHGTSFLEAAINNLVFAPLPPSIQQKLERRDASGISVPWFATPPAYPLPLGPEDEHPVVRHSVEYLVYKAKQQRQQV